MTRENEIGMLALDDLDIEELERRLELAPAATAAGWCGCGGGDCSELCAAKCAELCAVLVKGAVGAAGPGGPTC
jgi:hypothetical protein